MANLAQKAVQSVLWLLLSNGAVRGGQTLALLFIGALSGPEVMAPVAFIVTFLALSSMLFEDLFVYQLVRCTPEQRETYFPAARWYAIFVALGISLIVFPLTPWIARWVELPSLESHLRWCLLAVWAHALQVPSLAQLRIAMRFRQQFLLSLPNLVIMALLALLLLEFELASGAFLAITVGVACGQSLLLSIAVASPFSGMSPSREAGGQFLRYGGRLSLTNVINTLFAMVYLVVISRAFDAQALGQYFFADRARELVVLPFIGALQTVLFSTLSQEVLSRDALHATFRRSLEVMSFLVVPLCFAVAVHSESVFALLFDTSWSSAAQYLMVMALAATLIPLHSLNLTVNKYLGHADWLLRIELVKKLIAVLVLVVSVGWGVAGIVWGQFVVACIAVIINGWYADQAFDLRISRQVAIFALYVVVGVAAFALVYFAADFIAAAKPTWMRVALEFIAALLLYILGNALISSTGLQATISLLSSKGRHRVPG